MLSIDLMSQYIILYRNKYSNYSIYKYYICKMYINLNTHFVL